MSYLHSAEIAEENVKETPPSKTVVEHSFSFLFVCFLACKSPEVKGKNTEAGCDKYFQEDHRLKSDEFYSLYIFHLLEKVNFTLKHLNRSKFCVLHNYGSNK